MDELPSSGRRRGRVGGWMCSARGRPRFGSNGRLAAFLPMIPKRCRSRRSNRCASSTWVVRSLAWLAILLFSTVAMGAGRPNIVYILADDLGYGDVKCLNPSGKIATPNLDRLAAAGMVFTDAHSGSAVCSPTRYGILTGRYAWRSRLQAGVLGGCSPRLIEPGRLTVADLLRRAGYHTTAIGKWHLGMDWALTARQAPVHRRHRERVRRLERRLHPAHRQRTELGRLR